MLHYEPNLPFFSYSLTHHYLPNTSCTREWNTLEKHDELFLLKLPLKHCCWMKIVQILSRFNMYLFTHLETLLYLPITLSQAPIQNLDVGGMQALSRSMQNYSFVSSDSNRETEPTLLPKHVGVQTPGEHGWWAEWFLILSEIIMFYQHQK